MRIVFCWFEISGYMAASWRALAGREGVELKVIAFAAEQTAPFDAGLLAGVEHELLDVGQRQDAELVAQKVVDAKPDAVVICGWAHAPYTQLLHDVRLAGARFVMGMDTPWLGTLRQRMGWVKLLRHRRRLHRVLVTGERSFHLARQLKFPESQIARGMYGYDDGLFTRAYEARGRGSDYPRRFLYAGTYTLRKGTDLVLAGYAEYRRQVRDPWPLTCCGRGELEPAVNATQGVENLGFKQPAELPDIFAGHGAFVIASRYDPWPLVILEASGSGLPILCSEACGSAVELVRSYYNGITFPTGEIGSIARAMRWAHEHYSELSEMGRRGRELALAYSAGVWAQRIIEILKD